MVIYFQLNRTIHVQKSQSAPKRTPPPLACTWGDKRKKEEKKVVAHHAEYNVAI